MLPEWGMLLTEEIADDLEVYAKPCAWTGGWRVVATSVTVYERGTWLSARYCGIGRIFSVNRIVLKVVGGARMSLAFAASQF